MQEDSRNLLIDFLTCYQALLKAQLFFLSFVQLMEDNKVKIQLLFLSFFLLLFDTTLY